MLAAKALRLMPVLSALIPASAAFAQAKQTEPQFPSTVPSREEIRPTTPDQKPDGARVKIDSSKALDGAACPLDASDVRTTITEVRFTGARGAVLPPEIALLLQGTGGTGTDQPIKVVCEIRDRANAALRRAKYVAAVQVPAQRIDDGILRLEVITARIVEMRVRGDPGPYEKLLQGRIEALKRLNPLNEAAAEQLLLMAGDVPGLDVQLALRPTGDVPGDVIGDMTVSYRRFSLIANAQNYNSRQLGRETGYVRAEIYGLTGAADLTYFGISTTADFKEQGIVQAGHVMGLDDTGTSFGARATYAISKPDIEKLDLRTKSFIASLELARPVYRSVRANGGVIGGLEFASQRTTVGSTQGRVPLNLDRVTTLFVRATGDVRELKQNGDELFRTLATVELRKGIDVFGATKTGKTTSDGFVPSRFEGSATANVVRGQVETKIGVGPVFDLAGVARGQWSNKPLLNFDEFSVGNLTIGRGYDPGSNSGDRAVGASVELRAKVVRSPHVTIEAFGFYDAVRIWNLDRNSTENGRSLRSYGGGARMVLPGAMLLEVTYAHPKDRALSFDKVPPPDRVLVSLTMQLVPFGGRR
jgi:hemolysin activation/secretion protein